MDGLQWKILLKLIIWRYHHFRKPSFIKWNGYDLPIYKYTIWNGMEVSNRIISFILVIKYGF